MHLIDTNIFLEILLDQEKADDAERLLKTLQGKMWISDFSLFSIGIILFRRKEPTKLRAFLDDLKRGGFRLVRVDFDDMPPSASTGISTERTGDGSRRRIS
jgi:predicted nucleic acid-binding protein